MSFSVNVFEEVLARATNEDGTEVVELKELTITGDRVVIASHVHWALSHHLMDWEECCWDHLYSDPEAAIDAYVKERSRSYRTWSPEADQDIFRPVYVNVDETFGFNSMKANIDEGRNG